MNVGSLMTGTYGFDNKTGPLLTQQVKQGTATRLDLEYNYTLNNDTSNKGVKIGQLTGAGTKPITADYRRHPLYRWIVLWCLVSPMV